MSDYIDTIVGNGSDLSKLIAGLFIVIIGMTAFWLIIKLFRLK